MVKLDVIEITLFIIFAIATFFTGIIATVFNKKLAYDFYNICRKHKWRTLKPIGNRILLYLLGLGLIAASVRVSYLMIRYFLR